MKLTPQARVPLILIASSMVFISLTTTKCLERSVVAAADRAPLRQIENPDVPSWVIDPSSRCLVRSPPPIYGRERYCFPPGEAVIFSDGGSVW